MFSRVLNILYVVLIGVAFTGIELMTGGTRLLYSLPVYGVLALAALLSLGDLRRPKPSPDGPCLGASAVFFGYVLARALVSPVAYIAWADEFMVIGCLMLYLLTACYLTDPRRRLWVLWVLMALAIVNALVGLRQFAGGDNYMLTPFRGAPQFAGRACGLYICPDHLAGYLEAVGCLGLAAALWGRMRGWARLLLGYGAFMCFAGILFTGSRGGFISAGVGLLTVVLLGLGRVLKQSPGLFPRALLLMTVVTVLGVGVLCLYVLPNNEVIAYRLNKTFDLGHDERPLLWDAALREFQLAPAFGTGAATYVYYGRALRDPRMQHDPVYTHCDYLELLAEYGAAGAAGLVLFLGAHLWRGGQAYRALSLRTDGPETRMRGSNAAAWNIGALAAVACFLVHSVMDFNLHIPANALLFAFIFGVLANPGKPLDPASSPVARLRGVDLLPRLALPALGVWLAVAGLPKLPGEDFCERARVALRDRRYTAALDAASRGIERETQNPLLYYYLGQARQNLAGDGPDTPAARSYRLAASKAYLAGLRLAPMDIDLLVHEGEMRTRLGDFDGAVEVFEWARHCDPNSGYVYAYYGFCLQSRGQLDAAEAMYRQGGRFRVYEETARNMQEIAREQAAELSGK